MKTTRRQFVGGAAALGVATCLPAWAQQKTWPSRTVRIVVPYPPGGSSDIIGRLLAPRLGEMLKQTVVIENKPGANGNLGAGFVVQSGGDGHTILMCDVVALAISPSVYKQLTFDPSKDLRTVSMLAYSPHVLAVHPSVPANSLEELIALSKKQSVNFAVPAVGSAPHLAAIEIQEATKAEWEYVPYKGGAQALTDIVGGQTQVILNGLLATLPHIRSGNLRAIAISSRERMSQLPDVKTIAEQGVPNFESGTWQGLLAPSSFSDEAVAKLSEVMMEIANDPKIKAQLLEQGAEVSTQNPAEMSEFFERERARWAKVVERAKVSLD